MPSKTSKRPGKPAVRCDELLSGILPLCKPDYHKLNERDQRLLHACLCAYAKHTSWDCAADLGWEQVSEILHSAICETIGDDAYCQWADKMRELQPLNDKAQPRASSPVG